MSIYEKALFPPFSIIKTVKGGNWFPILSIQETIITRYALMKTSLHKVLWINIHKHNDILIFNFVSMTISILLVYLSKHQYLLPQITVQLLGSLYS